MLSELSARPFVKVLEAPLIMWAKHLGVLVGAVGVAGRRLTWPRVLLSLTAPLVRSCLQHHVGRVVLIPIQLRHGHTKQVWTPRAYSSCRDLLRCVRGWLGGRCLEAVAVVLLGCLLLRRH